MTERARRVAFRPAGCGLSRRAQRCRQRPRRPPFRRARQGRRGREREVGQAHQANLGNQSVDVDGQSTALLAALPPLLSVGSPGTRGKARHTVSLRSAEHSLFRLIGGAAVISAPAPRGPRLPDHPGRRRKPPWTPSSTSRSRSTSISSSRLWRQSIRARIPTRCAGPPLARRAPRASRPWRTMRAARAALRSRKRRPAMLETPAHPQCTLQSHACQGGERAPPPPTPWRPHLPAAWVYASADSGKPTRYTCEQ